MSHHVYEFLDCCKTGMRIMREQKGTEGLAAAEGDKGKGGV